MQSNHVMFVPNEKSLGIESFGFDSKPASVSCKSQQELNPGYRHILQQSVIILTVFRRLKEPQTRLEHKH